jgi:cystathionine beta-lyase family protein involved in aluminum resistance
MNRSPNRQSRDPLTLAAAVTVVAVLALAPLPALAQVADMPGYQLLQFARNYIIAPIALFAIVISGVAAFIRPEMIKTTGYVAIIAVILYFLLANADRVLQVMRAG